MAEHEAKIRTLQAGVDLYASAESPQEIANSLEILATSVMEMILSEGGNIRGQLPAESREFLARRRLRDELAYLMQNRQARVRAGQDNGDGGASESPTTTTTTTQARLAEVEAKDAAFNEAYAIRETQRIEERENGRDDTDDSA